MKSQIALDVNELSPASSLAVAKVVAKGESGFIVDNDDGSDLDIGGTQPDTTMEE